MFVWWQRRIVRIIEIGRNADREALDDRLSPPAEDLDSADVADRHPLLRKQARSGRASPRSRSHRHFGQHRFTLSEQFDIGGSGRGDDVPGARRASGTSQRRPGSAPRFGVGAGRPALAPVGPGQVQLLDRQFGFVTVDVNLFGVDTNAERCVVVAEARLQPDR